MDPTSLLSHPRLLLAETLLLDEDGLTLRWIHG